ncbi:MAG: hypothetical protein FWD28_07450 [Treponema sp.]|nr:hypothetical protein [Treponema sp.]
MEYRFSGEIDDINEYLQFQRILHKELFGKIFSPKSLIYSAFLLTIIIIQDLKREFSLYKIITYIVIIGFPCVFVFFALYSKWMNKRSFIKYKSKIGRFEFIINELNIFIKCKDESANLDKSNIRKIIFDNDSIYIIPKSRFGGIIKKRYFEDEKEYNELVLFIREKYSGLI